MKAEAASGIVIIRSSEGIDFPLYCASPALRALAVFVDLAVIQVAMQFVGMMLALFGLLSYDLAAGLSLVIGFALSMLYPMISEWKLGGRTLGKTLLGLRVVDSRGLRLQPSQVVMRNLARLADGFPIFYLLGAIVACLSPRSQRLGDLLAGTLVVHARRPPEALVGAILQSRHNSLLRHPALCRRLRQEVDPVLASITLSALAARDRLESEARLKVYASLAQEFKALAPFPEEELNSLSDEQLLRAIAAILYPA